MLEILSASPWLVAEIALYAGLLGGGLALALLTGERTPSPPASSKAVQPSYRPRRGQLPHTPRWHERQTYPFIPRATDKAL